MSMVLTPVTGMNWSHSRPSSCDPSALLGSPHHGNHSLSVLHCQWLCSSAHLIETNRNNPLLHLRLFPTYCLIYPFSLEQYSCCKSPLSFLSFSPIRLSPHCSTETGLFEKSPVLLVAKMYQILKDGPLNSSLYPQLLRISSHPMVSILSVNWQT